MLYNYGEILDFKYIHFDRALSFFVNSEKNFIDTVENISRMHGKVQEIFDITHPNISTSIAGYDFNKDTKTLSVDADIYMNAHGVYTLVDEYDTGRRSVIDTNVLSLSNIRIGLEYIKNRFLTKEDSSHFVSWTYNSTDSNITISYDELDSDSIPPYNTIASVFFLKRLENFPEIYSLSSASGQDNAFTKSIGVKFFNPKDKNSITCNTSSINGESFSISSNVFSSHSFVTYKTKEIIFDYSFVFSDNTPVSVIFSEHTYALNNISNVVAFMVRNVPFDDRANTEIISRDNVISRAAKLYDIDTSIIFDNFKVEISTSGDAATFRSIFQQLVTFLNNFYADKLKLFLSNYVDFGPLADMISYLQSKIDELKSKYVSNDECNIPLDSTDDGCDIGCDNIHLEEPKLMVTKQKLKSIVRCALMCDTMPYTEDDLAPVFEAPILKTDSQVSVPKPPQG